MTKPWNQERIEELIRYLKGIKTRPIMWFGHELIYDRLKMHLFGIYVGFQLMGVNEGWEMFRWVEYKWLPEGRWPQEPSEYIREMGWSEEESFYRLLDLHIEFWEQRLELKPE